MLGELRTFKMKTLQELLNAGATYYDSETLLFRDNRLSIKRIVEAEIKGTIFYPCDFCTYQEQFFTQLESLKTL